MKIAPDMDLGLLADLMCVDDELAAEYMRHMLVTQASCERARDVEARRPVPDVRVVAFCVESR